MQPSPQRAGVEPGQKKSYRPRMMPQSPKKPTQVAPPPDLVDGSIRYFIPGATKGRGGKSTPRSKWQPKSTSGSLTNGDQSNQDKEDKGENSSKETSLTSSSDASSTSSPPIKETSVVAGSEVTTTSCIKQDSVVAGVDVSSTADSIASPAIPNGSAPEKTLAEYRQRQRRKYQEVKQKNKLTTQPSAPSAQVTPPHRPVNRVRGFYSDGPKYRPKQAVDAAEKDKNDSTTHVDSTPKRRPVDLPKPASEKRRNKHRDNSHKPSQGNVRAPGVPQAPHTVVPTTKVKRKPKKTIFEEHWSSEQIRRGLQEGKLVQGVLRINQFRRNHAYVTVEGYSEDIFIEGVNINRAFEGDTVAIEIFPKEKWIPMDQAEDNADLDEEQAVITAKSAEESDGEEEDSDTETDAETDVESASDNDENDIDVDDESDTDTGIYDDDDEHESSPDGAVKAPVMPQTPVSVGSSILEDADTASPTPTASPASPATPVTPVTSVSSAPSAPITPSTTASAIHSTSATPASSAASATPSTAATPATPTSTSSSQTGSGRKLRLDKAAAARLLQRSLGVYAQFRSINKEQSGSEPASPSPSSSVASVIQQLDQLTLADKASTQQTKDENEAKGSQKRSAQEHNDSSTTSEPKRLRPTGRVVGIIEAEHRRRKFVGTLEPLKKTDRRAKGYVSFIPTDKRAPKFLIPIRYCPDDYATNPDKYSTQLFSAEFITWQSTTKNPTARLIEQIGMIGDLAAEMAALLQENGITPEEDDFSPDLLKQLPDKFILRPRDLKERRDFRNTRIFSIDPSTARDLDDALSIRPLGNGKYEVGVHIADVTHYVKPNTPLDRLARTRSTSTYMVHKCIRMLPPILSEVLCSLNAGEDRLAFSVLWTLDRDGNIESEWFGKSIIRSCAKLSYDEAQTVIETFTLESDGPDPVFTVSPESVAKIEEKQPLEPAIEICKDIVLLHLIAKRLRKRRFDGGALTINRVKLSFLLDYSYEPPIPLGIKHYENKEANHLVEEFMLLANMSVARYIHKYFTDSALLRNHPPPLGKKLGAFLEMMHKLKIPIIGTSAGELQASIKALPDDIRFLVEDLAARTLQPAEYVASGLLKPGQNLKHYALNVELYTHFTSPIRRYPDIIVHRQLYAALKFEQQRKKQEAKLRGRGIDTLITVELRAPVPLLDLLQICRNANKRKLAARKAQEQSENVYLCTWLKQNPLVDENCRVMELGEKFVKFYSRQLGRAVRVFLGELDKRIKIKWDEERQTLCLAWNSEEMKQEKKKQKKNKKKNKKNKNKKDADEKENSTSENSTEKDESSSTSEQSADNNESATKNEPTYVPDRSIELSFATRVTVRFSLAKKKRPPMEIAATLLLPGLDQSDGVETIVTEMSHI